MNNLALDYLALRKLIGIQAAALPIVLFMVAGDAPSLSAYYGGPGRDIFVGTLFVIGALLGAYRGHDRRDRIVSMIAGISITTVALAPWDTHPLMHNIAAGLFFACMAVFCGLLFPLGRRYRSLYRAAGGVIVGAALGVWIGAPLYACEVVAVLAFAAAWICKGLSDRRTVLRLP